MTEKLNALGAGWMDALWNASVQGGLALLVVWCICRFVPRISPRFKVWLWRLAWFKLLLTLFWTGSIDLPLLGPVSHPPAAVRSLPAVTIPQTLPVDAPGVSEASLNSRAVLFVAWLIGVLCSVLHLGYQWSRSTRLGRSAPPLKNSGLGELCSTLGIARAPGLRESSEISSPVLIGILRPTIIVPSASVTGDQLQMMLAHELAHLKRRDLLWGWLPAICHALFFFHPLLWVTRREWLLAQEMACDELALRHASTSPSAYGNMLIDLITSVAPRARFGTLSICETTRNLKRRILAMKTIGIPKSRGLMFALAIAGIAAILPWRIVAQDKPEDTGKRIEQLERENAELRAELDKLKQAEPHQKFTSEDLRAAESARLARQGQETDLARQIAAEISAVKTRLKTLRTHFTDQHPTVLHAQNKLEQLKERQAELEGRRPAAGKDVVARQRELYLEEIALAQKHFDSVRKLAESGLASQEDVFRTQRQMFALRRELATLEKDSARLKELVHEEMAIIQRLLKEARKRFEMGLSPQSEEFNLQRELLRLKRELLSLE